MGDVKKLLAPLRKWQKTCQGAGPFQVPDYGGFVQIVEAIEVGADRLAALEAERDALREAVREAAKILQRAVADADDAEAFFQAKEWLAKHGGQYG